MITKVGPQFVEAGENGDYKISEKKANRSILPCATCAEADNLWKPWADFDNVDIPSEILISNIFERTCRDDEWKTFPLNNIFQTRFPTIV